MVNNPQEPSTPNYVIGYTPSSEQLFSRRTAASHAGYLLPYLKAGMKVLDIGCGPGSISVGLADAVVPGELYGIDMEQSQVEFAVAAARKGEHDNARFQVGDAGGQAFVLGAGFGGLELSTFLCSLVQRQTSLYNPPDDL